MVVRIAVNSNRRLSDAFRVTTFCVLPPPVGVNPC